MNDYEDRELEEKLRSLPTTEPAAGLRDRILRAAARPARRGRGWKPQLAYALILLGLVALDVGIDRVQSARLSELIGDGRQAAAGEAQSFPLKAFRERRAMMLAMLKGEQIR
jgi:hypothetical protein